MAKVDSDERLLALPHKCLEINRGHGTPGADRDGERNKNGAILRSLAGRVGANVGSGAIVGVDLGYEPQRAQALLKHEIVPTRTAPERTAFGSFAVTGMLENGVMFNDPLIIQMGYLGVSGQDARVAEPPGH